MLLKMGQSIPQIDDQDLHKIPSFAGTIGRWEEWKGGRVEACSHPSFSFQPSVQNAPIKQQVRKS